MWKYVADDSIVVPLDDIRFDESLNYVNRLVAILDRKTKSLHSKVVVLVKVKLQHQMGLWWILEPNEEIREHYPELFAIVDIKQKV